MILLLALPYSDLQEVLPFNGDGMYINAVPMEKVLRENNVKTVVELGSWLGKSTRHIASVLPEDGVVYAVDHWLGSEEHVGSHHIPVLYEQFLSNVIHAELTEKIVPIRLKTLDAVDYIREKGIVPDLIYVDASHDEESVYTDLINFYPLVQGRGILCGDDWHWGRQHGYPVLRAVTRFAKERFLRIEVFGEWFWVLREEF